MNYNNCAGTYCKKVSARKHLKLSIEKWHKIARGKFL
jgi:hypothetical protein